MSGEIAVFTVEDARRIGDAVRNFERIYRNRPQPGKTLPAPFFQALIPVTLGSGITAGTVSTPTTATGTLLKPSGTGGGLTSSGKTATIYNPYAKAVASGKFAWVTPYNNRLYLVTADC